MSLTLIFPKEFQHVLILMLGDMHRLEAQKGKNSDFDVLLSTILLSTSFFSCFLETSVNKTKLNVL